MKIRDHICKIYGRRDCEKFKNRKPEGRYLKRQKNSKPLLEEFFAWASSLNATPKTGIGMAVHYALSQRKYLERFLLDRRCEISNNRTERSIKLFVIDRKKLLFANTPRSAKASAIMFSLIETAKGNGLNPYEYLVYVFKNAPNLNIRNDIDTLWSLSPTSAAPHIRPAADS